MNKTSIVKNLLKYHEDDAKNIEGSTVIVTGASVNGLGFYTAEAFLYFKAKKVILGMRSEAKALDTIKELKKSLGKEDLPVEFIHLDLADEDSVDKFSKEVHEKIDSLNYGIFNAGIMMTPTLKHTKQGHELQVGVNYINHLKLTYNLWDLFEKGYKESEKPSRIVNVSSQAQALYAPKKLDEIMKEFPKYETMYDKETNYGISKFGNVVATHVLQKKLNDAKRTDIIIDSCHPGLASTDLGRDMNFPAIMMKMVAKLSNPPWFGAIPNVVAAIDSSSKGGNFYGPKSGVGALILTAGPLTSPGSAAVKSKLGNPLLYDDEACLKMFEATEELLNIKFKV